ncbi:uncharacterized protein CANTADRAFT_4700 [Suhomyces tanzawaensis NRRL Y-17324]|uniref:Amino acid transporter transmembrane domain-containing protein n=1 Tax=Suhomyces tanzawaensis NRRL Y-17324 TaxID=984487 RepID=A0A1E4SMG9_9ASCO|nr:uncharacterized protein CANTADRAFT_4700 [Suhomyces tanzawaensis NRRL Y-17324]ODV80685.1 hypothetical protein CANTADRAFT_4700 [Suhomyces tanzawaensis NRRL Y-17324]
MSYHSDIEGSPSRTRRKSILDYGGANSINNFASSYTRAQKHLGSDLFANAIEDDVSPNTSPLIGAVADGIDEQFESLNGRRSDSGSYRSINEFHFPIDDQIKGQSSLRTSPFGSASNATEQSSLLSSSSDHRKLATVYGSSTSAQTIFNAINSIMGMAMLSLPFGLRLSGWILGSCIYLASAVITSHTASILGKIIKRNPHLRSYSDISYLYGGKWFLILITIIFSLDLSGASLSLILLFSDSFNILVPGIAKSEWKMMIVTSAFFLSFLPLSFLSIISLSGIICTLSVIVVFAMCGVFIDVKPGSLLNPEPTSFYPVNFMSLLLTLGIFMAPWGGHPMFPELYKDMKKPAKFDKCVRVTFSTTFILCYLLGVIGYLMYGLGSQDSIIKNVLSNDKYPNLIKNLFCLFMGILPVSKLPLTTRPLITVYESVLNVQPTTKKPGVQPHNIKKVILRFVFCCVLLAVSLLFSSFGKLVSFLGSAICFTICITLPLMFYLKFFNDELSWSHKLLLKVGIVLSMTGAIAGTYASISMDIL